MVEVIKQNEYERMLATLECIGDGVISIDKMRNIDFLNSVAEEYLGWKHSEALGKKVEDVFNLYCNNKIKPILSLIDITFEKGTPVGLKRNSMLITKEGKLKYISASISPIKSLDGSITGTVIVFRDITKLKLTEEKIEAERNNFKTVFNSSPIGMFIINSNAVVREANHMFLELFGVKAGETVNHRIGEVIGCKNSYNGCGCAEECQLCKFRSGIANLLEDKKAHYEVGIYYTKSRNAFVKRWLSMSFIEVLLTDEKLILITVEDITELKTQEEQLRNSKDEAEKANIAKSEFLTNMSHEIRTPLNGMIGMIDLTLLTELTHDQRDNLKSAKICAGTLLNLINDILDFSKMEAGKLLIDSFEFNIEDVVRDTIKVHLQRAWDKNIKLTYEIMPLSQKLLVGDPNRVQQILNNLISNSIKFTNQGEIKVRVEENHGEKGEIELFFTISDTGIGIEKDKMERLFKRFSQVDSTLTRKYGGTGLGLAICKQLTEMMGGKIWAESEKGYGSKFFFTIKFFEGQDKLIGSEPLNEIPLNNNSYDILLAEDDKINQIVLSRILAEKGHKVDIAKNGKEVLSMLERNKYHGILMDIQMPEMDGIVATQRIREIERHTGGHIPIIAQTAHALHGDRERFLSYGMDGYVSKPVQINLLYEEIDRVMGATKEYEYLNKLQGTPGCNSGSLINRELNNELLYEKLNSLKGELFGAFNNERMESIEVIAHKIKEIASENNLEELKICAFRIELSSRRGNLNEISDQLHKLNIEKPSLNNIIN